MMMMMMMMMIMMMIATFILHTYPSKEDVQGTY